MYMCFPNCLIKDYKETLVFASHISRWWTDGLN